MYPTPQEVTACTFVHELYAYVSEQRIVDVHHDEGKLRNSAKLTPLSASRAPDPSPDDIY